MDGGGVVLGGVGQWCKNKGVLKLGIERYRERCLYEPPPILEPLQWKRDLSFIEERA